MSQGGTRWARTHHPDRGLTPQRVSGLGTVGPDAGLTTQSVSGLGPVGPGLTTQRFSGLGPVGPGRGLTEGLEHGGLLSEGGSGPVQDLPQLSEHRSLRYTLKDCMLIIHMTLTLTLTLTPLVGEQRSGKDSDRDVKIRY